MSFLRRIIRHPVTHNAAGMYGVMVASYVLPLITLPYLARVLRPEQFGLLLFAQSFASWSSLTVEYGFNLSATREIARNRGNQSLLSEIAAGVLGAKGILLLGLTAIAMVAGLSVSHFREHPEYLFWALAQALALGFSPFWYFQGTETKMVRSVVVDFTFRTIGTLFVFVIVHRPEDGWKAMALQAVAGCASTLILTLWMHREITFSRPTWRNSVNALRDGWSMFFFRGAYNIYSTSNTFVLGLFASPVQVGYFGGAQRIARAIQGLTIPLAQAVYPRMSQIASQDKMRAARMAKFTLLFNGGAGLILSAALVFTARWVVRVGLGPGYEPSIGVLYVFAFFLPINAANSALIMHWMLPLGLENTVGKITSGAIVLNLILATVLASRFAHVGMAWVMVIAECSKLVALVRTVVRARLNPLSMPAKSKPQTAESL